MKRSTQLLSTSRTSSAHRSSLDVEPFNGIRLLELRTFMVLCAELVFVEKYIPKHTSRDLSFRCGSNL